MGIVGGAVRAGVTGCAPWNSSSATATYGTTGPSRHKRSGPSWQWPHSPTRHCILRSNETLIRDGLIPWSTS